LKSIMLEERSLDRVQLIAVREPFDRRDLVAFVRYREAETGIDPPAIHQDRARTALAVVAAFF
jgi:hypothetical protein